MGHIEYTLKLVKNILKKHSFNEQEQESIELHALDTLKEAIQKFNPQKNPNIKKRIHFLITHRVNRAIKNEYNKQKIDYCQYDHNQPYAQTSTYTQIIAQYQLNKSTLPTNRQKIADMILIKDMTVKSIAQLTNIPSTSIKCIKSIAIT